MQKLYEGSDASCACVLRPELYGRRKQDHVVDCETISNKCACNQAPKQIMGHFIVVVDVSCCSFLCKENLPLSSDVQDESSPHTYTRKPATIPGCHHSLTCAHHLLYILCQAVWLDNDDLKSKRVDYFTICSP